MADDRTSEKGQNRDVERETGSNSTARDREIGRGGEPQGDLGEGRRTWQPPDGEQGMSNRPGDRNESEEDLAGENDEENDEDDDEFDDDDDDQDEPDDDKDEDDGSESRGA